MSIASSLTAALGRPQGRNSSIMGTAVLGAFVVLTLLMLVVPLPTAVLDSAIAINLCGSVLILLTALFLPEPVRLPSFPTIILVSTLFRLAINVSSTRLILGEADAGEIIRTFGEFAAGGSIVVGAVVFVVLTVVQFIVVAKGSERVAEVAARFTLDAMQGRQLAIDADLSGGRITNEEATRRRSLLDRENKLYGAMDGAMKFVKGDAIAGIVISMVNIVAGLVMGVFSNGLSAGEAAELYTIMTVGDGLVSQIPSLLISVAAGLVVTRVADANASESNAATDIATQLAQLPTALLGTALMMFVVAATSGLTGFPPFQFLVLGVFLAALGVPILLRQRATRAMTEDGAATTAKDAAVRGIDLQLVVSERLSICMDPALFPTDERSQQALRAELAGATASVSQTRGIPMPKPVIQADERFAGGFGIYINSRLCAKVKASATGGIVTRLTETLEANAAEFLGFQDVSNLLEAIRRTHPDLVNQVQNATGRQGASLSTARTAELLREIAGELVPLTDLPLVLSGLVTLGGQPLQQETLSEAVRPSILPLILASAETSPGVIAYIGLETTATEQLAQDSVMTDDERMDRFVGRVRRVIREAKPAPRRVAIVVAGNPAHRARVRASLRKSLPLIPVLTAQEAAAANEAMSIGSIGEL